MIHAFEDITLDTALFELRRAGDVVPVEPQVFELLALLVRERGRVVTRDEILDVVWNGRIVSDAALSSRIKAARRAIGDDGERQRLIRTVRGRGFRFLGDVRVAALPAAVAAPALPPEGEGDGADPARAAEALSLPLLDRPAIAVLPFSDATGDGQDNYLADGLTDEVIAALSAWRVFPVISRNTAFRFRGAGQTAQEAGSATGARYLVTGRLVRDGPRVRLWAALIDAAEDRQLWSGRFNRAADQIFDLEEELAAEVVSVLEPEMHNAEFQRVMRKRPENMTAWDLAMRAAWHVNRMTPADLDAADDLARRAVDLDPAWSYPHALIAVAAFQRAMRAWSGAAAETAFVETLAEAQRALEVDRNLWMAHALAGVGELWTHRHYDRALAHVYRAIQLNPSAAWCYHFCGCIAGFAGDLDVALAQGRRVFRVDPAYPYTAVVEADLALWSMLSDDLGEASLHIERALQWDPDYGRGWQRYVALHGLRGDRESSGRGIARLRALDQPVSRDYLASTYPFRNPEHAAVFFTGLRRAGVNV
ncbi:winged helix-turn-helix domain-containing protein [Futiania mangrovi]|uniref:Winged helix-turn-helix domain-containing protein n=1 Tax=Futiania mangrovi TaxID=2959716 RepID=A0A9J6PAT9_9PROT|nr:winged helix-turn-helix domain-containing protein [Futiania mangrovii]MCP1335561.1 winged helix-turn-helix domain-containing protein [Futiania mangrovii]